MTNYRAMLAVKEEELEVVRARAEAAERQLKIQTKVRAGGGGWWTWLVQVNAEVKRLLVASVGEDIEARVDFLTQDKARLAQDVMQYRSASTIRLGIKKRLTSPSQ